MGEWREVWYPDRKKIRHFTAKDVARISKYALRDGASPLDILGGVVLATGFGVLICKAAKAVRAGLSITAFLKKLAVIQATGSLVALLIQLLVGAKLVTPPGLQWILAIAISVLMFIDSVFKAFQEMVGDRAVMLEITATLDDLCKKVVELGGEAIDYACQSDSDICQAAKDMAEKASFEMKTDVEKAIEVLDQEQYPKWWEWL